MPIRRYRCEAGHEFEQFEAMDQPPQEICAQLVWAGSGELVTLSTEGPVPTSNVTTTCMKPVERIIQSTQRPIVKGGTRIHHGMKGVE